MFMTTSFAGYGIMQRVQSGLPMVLPYIEGNVLATILSCVATIKLCSLGTIKSVIKTADGLFY